MIVRFHNMQRPVFEFESIFDASQNYENNVNEVFVEYVKSAHFQYFTYQIADQQLKLNNANVIGKVSTYLQSQNVLIPLEQKGTLFILPHENYKIKQYVNILNVWVPVKSAEVQNQFDTVLSPIQVHQQLLKLISAFNVYKQQTFTSSEIENNIEISSDFLWDEKFTDIVRFTLFGQGDANTQTIFQHFITYLHDNKLIIDVSVEQIPGSFRLSHSQSIQIIKIDESEPEKQILNHSKNKNQKNLEKLIICEMFDNENENDLSVIHIEQEPIHSNEQFSFENPRTLSRQLQIYSSLQNQNECGVVTSDKIEMDNQKDNGIEKNKVILSNENEQEQKIQIVASAVDESDETQNGKQVVIVPVNVQKQQNAQVEESQVQTTSSNEKQEPAPNTKTDADKQETLETQQHQVEPKQVPEEQPKQQVDAKIVAAALVLQHNPQQQHQQPQEIVSNSNALQSETQKSQNEPAKESITADQGNKVILDQSLKVEEPQVDQDNVQKANTNLPEAADNSQKPAQAAEQISSNVAEHNQDQSHNKDASKLLKQEQNLVQQDVGKQTQQQQLPIPMAVNVKDTDKQVTQPQAQKQPINPDNHQPEAKAPSPTQDAHAKSNQLQASPVSATHKAAQVQQSQPKQEEVKQNTNHSVPAAVVIASTLAPKQVLKQEAPRQPNNTQHNQQHAPVRQEQPPAVAESSEQPLNAIEPKTQTKADDLTKTSEANKQQTQVQEPAQISPTLQTNTLQSDQPAPQAEQQTNVVSQSAKTKDASPIADKTSPRLSNQETAGDRMNKTPIYHYRSDSRHTPSLNKSRLSNSTSFEQIDKQTDISQIQTIITKNNALTQSLLLKQQQLQQSKQTDQNILNGTTLQTEPEINQKSVLEKQFSAQLNNEPEVKQLNQNINEQTQEQKFQIVASAVDQSNKTQNGNLVVIVPVNVQKQQNAQVEESQVQTTSSNEKQEPAPNTKTDADKQETLETQQHQVEPKQVPEEQPKQQVDAKIVAAALVLQHNPQQQHQQPQEIVSNSNALQSETQKSQNEPAKESITADQGNKVILDQSLKVEEPQVDQDNVQKANTNLPEAADNSQKPAQAAEQISSNVAEHNQDQSHNKDASKLLKQEQNLVQQDVGKQTQQQQLPIPMAVNVKDSDKQVTQPQAQKQPINPDNHQPEAKAPSPTQDAHAKSNQLQASPVSATHKAAQVQQSQPKQEEVKQNTNHSVPAAVVIASTLAPKQELKQEAPRQPNNTQHNQQHAPVKQEQPPAVAESSEQPLNAIEPKTQTKADDLTKTSEANKQQTQVQEPAQISPTLQTNTLQSDQPAPQAEQQTNVVSANTKDTSKISQIDAPSPQPVQQQITQEHLYASVLHAESPEVQNIVQNPQQLQNENEHLSNFTKPKSGASNINKKSALAQIRQTLKSKGYKRTENEPEPELDSTQNFTKQKPSSRPPPVLLQIDDLNPIQNIEPEHSIEPQHLEPQNNNSKHFSPPLHSRIVFSPKPINELINQFESKLTDKQKNLPEKHKIQILKEHEKLEMELQKIEAKRKEHEEKMQGTFTESLVEWSAKTGTQKTLRQDTIRQGSKMGQKTQNIKEHIITDKEIEEAKIIEQNKLIIEENKKLEEQLKQSALRMQQFNQGNKPTNQFRRPNNVKRK
ncbi:Hypothetical_protein [Hexamita inflata]|uniref:Hypothetical_protein n=1 Tax=Hexamita inflata TaxID=28002 RepID=A0AA86P5C6_9EUKA|nr:Hypothetical protein HINF_LOCUS18626 [Hexamita inflata]